MNESLVSILMTAYNREKYISESIKSVLASSYKNFELIIVDDCSKDATVEIAKKFAVLDNRIKIFINEKNLGDYPNRNKAASYATGKYLKYLDSDDIIYPWGLAAMVFCMEQFPNAGYGLVSYGLKDNQMFPSILTPNQAYYSFYFQGSMIGAGPTGSIIKKEVFEKVQGFSGKPYVGDTELWLKISREYSLVQMPLNLVWWREHEEQEIKKELNNKNHSLNRYLINRNALKHEICPFNQLYSENALRNLRNRYSRNICIMFMKGQIKESINFCKKSKLNILDIVKAVCFNTYPPKL